MEHPGVRKSGSRRKDFPSPDFCERIQPIRQKFPSPLTQWQQKLGQQGQYPGDNTSRLEITNDRGDVSSAEDSWNDIDPSGN
jgi:hypothetical protein